MKITIAAVGKMKSATMREMYESYRGRISWDVALKEVEEKRQLPVEQLKQKEGELLLKAAPKPSFKIAMDEKGRQLGSYEFADMLEKWQGGGQNRLTFLFGGADGLGRNVLDVANFRFSLGHMTWPHMMARVMLMEQLYRAYSIVNSHPYHRG